MKRIISKIFCFVLLIAVSHAQEFKETSYDPLFRLKNDVYVSFKYEEQHSADAEHKYALNLLLNEQLVSKFLRKDGIVYICEKGKELAGAFPDDFAKILVTSNKKLDKFFNKKIIAQFNYLKNGKRNLYLSTFLMDKLIETYNCEQKNIKIEIINDLSIDGYYNKAFSIIISNCDAAFEEPEKELNVEVESNNEEGNQIAFKFTSDELKADVSEKIKSKKIYINSNIIINDKQLSEYGTILIIKPENYLNEDNLYLQFSGFKFLTNKKIQIEWKGLIKEGKIWITEKELDGIIKEARLKYKENQSISSKPKEYQICFNFRNKAYITDLLENNNSKFIFINKRLCAKDLEFVDGLICVKKTDYVFQEGFLSLKFEGIYKYFSNSFEVRINYKNLIKGDRIIITEEELKAAIKLELSKDLTFTIGFLFEDNELFNDFAERSKNKIIHFQTNSSKTDVINDKKVIQNYRQVKITDPILIIKEGDYINMTFEGFNYFLNDIKIDFSVWKEYVMDDNFICIPESLLVKTKKQQHKFIELTDYIIYEIYKIKPILFINGKNTLYKVNQLRNELIIDCDFNENNTIEFKSQNNMEWLRTNKPVNYLISKDLLNNGTVKIKLADIKEIITPICKVRYSWGNYCEEINDLPKMISTDNKDIEIEKIKKMIGKYDIVVNLQSENLIEFKINRLKNKFTLDFTNNEQEKPIKIEIFDNLLSNRKYETELKNNEISIFDTESPSVKMYFTWPKPKRGFWYSKLNINEKEPNLLISTHNIECKNNRVVIDNKLRELAIVEFVLFDATLNRDNKAILKKLELLEQQRKEEQIVGYRLLFIYSKNEIYTVDSWDDNFETQLNNQMGNGEQNVHLKRSHSEQPLIYKNIMSEVIDNLSFLDKKFSIYLIQTTLYLSRNSKESFSDEEIKEFKSKMDAIKYNINNGKVIEIY